MGSGKKAGAARSSKKSKALERAAAEGSLRIMDAISELVVGVGHGGLRVHR